MPTRQKKQPSPEKPETAIQHSPSHPLPIFFRDPHPLNPSRHATASIRTATYGFAKQTNSVPIIAHEFFQVAKHYPIVFTAGDSPRAVAVLGLEQTNYFITKDHQWRPHHYIPAYVRQYPFLFLEPTGQTNLYLMIDEAAPHYSSGQHKLGTPLYNPLGEPTPAVKNAQKFCSEVYAEYKRTIQLCEWLKAQNLLVPSQSDVRLASGKAMKLEGFQVLDEKTFGRIPESELTLLRTEGWLGALYNAFSSATNWQRLLDYAEFPEDAAT